MQELYHHYFAINPQTGLVDLNWLVVVLLIVSGFAVGIINTVAGAGTAITYSLFMFFGLPANMANGTIRFGVIMQTLASSLTFANHKKLDWKKGLWLAIPVILGTILGAQMAVVINQDAFKKVLGIVLLLLLFFVFYDPKKWLEEQIQKTRKKVSPVQYLVFFFLGIYGGFIHIGVGIFLLGVLVMQMGYDLVKANALKVFLVLLYSPFALYVFIMGSQVNYSYGLISALGNVLGGIVASRLAVVRGAGLIRWLLVIVLVFFSSQLLFFS